jgi:hypothetical protein
MAGPLSGLQGQTVPLSSPYQPGQNPAQQVRARADQVPEDNRVQPQNAAAADTQDSQSSRREDKEYDQRRADSLSDEERASARRGSLVDIKV